MKKLHALVVMMRMELWNNPLVVGIEVHVLCVHGWILHVVHALVESVHLWVDSLDVVIWMHVWRVYAVSWVV